MGNVDVSVEPNSVSLDASVARANVLCYWLPWQWMCWGEGGGEEKTSKEQKEQRMKLRRKQKDNEKVGEEKSQDEEKGKKKD